MTDLKLLPGGKDISDDLVSRFIALFPHSDRSHGTFVPKTGKGFTVKEPVKRLEFENHLVGAAGLGLVSIMDDNSCSWAAIDIDVSDGDHKNKPNTYKVSTEEVASRIIKLDLPLIPCRSKSGGTHCYAFFSKPQSAAYARGLLKKYAVRMGFATAEIFPKQDKLTQGAMGSWLNLPYFDARDTKRFALVGDKPASLEFFIETAESLKADKHTSTVQSDGNINVDRPDALKFDFSQGPPCVRKIFEEHAGENQRNNSLWMAGVWLKRQHPDDWKDYLVLFNEQAFARPLELPEFKKIQGSVNKRDYAYKCKDEPCLSLCEKDLCKKLKFGVRMGTDYTNLPTVDKLVMVASDPPTWQVHIFDAVVSMTTIQLRNAYMFHLRVMDITRKLIAVAKDDEWSLFLRDLLDNHTEVVGPEQGIGGNDAFNMAFAQFIRDAQTDKQEPDEAQRRRYIFNTGAAVLGAGEEARVVFRSAHLLHRLNMQYNLKMDLRVLLDLLKKAGAEPTKGKFSGIRIGVWMVPYEPIVDEHATTFKPEY